MIKKIGLSITIFSQNMTLSHKNIQKT